MKLCKIQLESGAIRVGSLEEGHVQLLNLEGYPGVKTLSDLLHVEKPGEVARDLIDESVPALLLEDVTFLAPLDRQEVWAAGVTYKRSEEARKRESVGAAQFYDLVYAAPRPEIFFKATPHRVVGPGNRVRIRQDSKWSVPEPELALVLSPRLEIVGYSIGNDMSARDIEGENPLYLPQAKVYEHCCALGPVVTLAEAMPPADRVSIKLTIERAGKKAFEGGTELTRMNRRLEDLVDWLGRDNSFPDGAVLLTGTGIVPPDDFSLRAGDFITIEITGIGVLSNLVEQGSA
ncbi:MAG: fumarylacetoacetate hydrolase family protein [Gemmataceae bacterium]